MDDDRTMPTFGELLEAFETSRGGKTMDEEKIKTAISVLVPGAEAGTTHLKLLSKVAVMLMQEDFRETVKASNDPEAIAALINENLEDDEDEL